MMQLCTGDVDRLPFPPHGMSLKELKRRCKKEKQEDHDSPGCSPESISTQNKFEQIFGSIGKNCDNKLTRKWIN